MLRLRSAEHAARTRDVLDSFGPILDHAVRELQEQNTTIVAIPPAVLSARIVRFRRGDSVLEIDIRKDTGAGVTSGSRSRLGRQGKEDEGETVKRYLANALATVV